MIKFAHKNFQSDIIVHAYQGVCAVCAVSAKNHIKQLVLFMRIK